MSPKQVSSSKKHKQGRENAEYVVLNSGVPFAWNAEMQHWVQIVSGNSGKLVQSKHLMATNEVVHGKGLDCEGSAFYGAMLFPVASDPAVHCALSQTMSGTLKILSRAQVFQ